MSGTLYLVATPIGNLGDFSPRAAETLGAVDFIAAEDTRVSVKLLNHFQIKKPLVSYHEHNHAAAGQAILQRLLAGESCALVTDAGTPAISDPGEDLVRLCAENGVEVLSIPGCCAAVNALAVSGLPTGRFTFEGFITVNKNAIPNDPEKPFVTSGIRVGTPAATTRGLKEEDMKEIARIMGGENPSVLLLETAREELKRWQKDLLAEGEDGQET